MPPAVELVAAIVIVALLTARQVRRRAIRQDAPVVLNVLLLAFGAFTLVGGLRSVTDHHPLAASTLSLLGLNLVAAAGFGVLRAHTVRIYRALDGTAMRAGGAATVLAWLASLGAHLLLDKAIDASAGVGSLGLSTIYLYLGITLMIQNWRIRASARRLAAQPPAGDPAVAGRL